MGPRTARDFEVFPHIERIEGRISGEQMLCGRGLVNLYRAVAVADGKPAEFTSPAGITAAALAEIRSGGRGGARHLRHLPWPARRRSGADLHEPRRRLPDRRHRAEDRAGAADIRGFRAAFEDKAPHSAPDAADLPVFVMTHPLAALAGLGAFARTPQAFHIRTTGGIGAPCEADAADWRLHRGSRGGIGRRPARVRRATRTGFRTLGQTPRPRSAGPNRAKSSR